MKKRSHRLLWPALSLLALLVYNAFASDTFFQVELREGRLYGTPVDIFHQGAAVMLLALGMSLVIATGGIDLSVGSVMALSGAVAAVAVRNGVAAPTAFAMALGVSTLVGVFNGALARFGGVQPIVATLVTLMVIRGVAMGVADGEIVAFEDETFVALSTGHWLGVKVAIWIVAMVAVSLGVLLRFTALGPLLEAVGDNEKAARIAGLSTRGVPLLAYTICSACAGLAGLLAAASIKAADANRAGTDMELNAIFAVVAGGAALQGGRISLVGALLGAVLLQALTLTLYDQGVSPFVTPIPKALVILGACLLGSPSFRASIARWLRRPS